jgi:hypothetical protein
VAKAFPANELATRIFIITVGGIGAFCAVVFLFIL